MWRIIKAEISYHVGIFIIYLCLTVGVTFVEQQFEDGGRFYVAILLFLIVQNWLSFKAKSKRDVLFARLPLAGLTLGGIRIVMIVVSALLITVVYKGMHALLGIQGHANYPVTGWKLVNYYSIVLFLFSIYFIFSDLVAPRLREFSNFEIIKERSIQILLLLLILLQILGMVAFLTQAPNFVIALFDLFYSHNPFDKVKTIQILLFISVLIAACSCFTFSKRRNYI
ncbi:hypothetical protein EH223_16130 [candidate division KSB1 bacterium]|nr:hypothetical protein [candidate division KSB1 bacterium]RQW01055.1 MAG: hypothetical protein EH223_16130 [candidate division KSB1 bacterium]